MYVFFLIGYFLNPHPHPYFCIGVVRAQVRLFICTGSPESLHGRLCDNTRGSRKFFQRGSSLFLVNEWIEIQLKSAHHRPTS